MRARELVLLVLVAFLAVLQVAPGAEKRDAGYANFKTFVTVLEQVKRSYVVPVDDEKLFYGAFKGMLAELDPYSQFMTREDVEQLEVDTEGEFGGLGIEITLDQNRILTVITPLEDTPAMKAGVLPGDRIVEIEGHNTYNITLMEAVKRLRGKPGTKVTITVVHQFLGKRETITLTRDIIKVRSVRARKMVDAEGKIGYIRINNFQRTTAEELEQAVKELVGEGMKALVLDLRRNPGGLLDSAVAVADLFIEKGVIVSTKGRNPDAVHQFDAHKEGTYSDFPLAVLVSNFSASGSEIVAGAIQDSHRGLIVGQRSYGKASVQSILSLDNGCKLRLTTARYYTPAGRLIHREIDAKEDGAWGIHPDLEVKTTYEDEVGLGEHFRDERVSESTKNGTPIPPEPAPPVEGEEKKKEGEKKEGEKKPFVDAALVRAMDALKAILVYEKR
ncbi:MAG TPA: S41 family peptidase [Planctomycetota bacterium]|nr:S41 family peptidase [Planctomycetota bacterium]